MWLIWRWDCWCRQWQHGDADQRSNCEVVTGRNTQHFLADYKRLDIFDLYQAKHPSLSVSPSLAGKERDQDWYFFFLVSVTSSESNYTFMNEFAHNATTKKRLGSDEGSRVISAQITKELSIRCFKTYHLRQLLFIFVTNHLNVWFYR